MASPSSTSNPTPTHHAGNLLEIIWLALADDVNLVIHAMPLNPTVYDLLPQTKEDMQ